MVYSYDHSQHHVSYNVLKPESNTLEVSTEYRERFGILNIYVQTINKKHFDQNGYHKQVCNLIVGRLSWDQFKCFEKRF